MFGQNFKFVNSTKSFKLKRGFTLIELLVVIVIIGILATLATVTLSSARAKARDARRVSDVKQIQTALELYYNDVTSYPATALVSTNLALFNGTTTYMAKIPGNPLTSDGGCTGSPGTLSYYLYTGTSTSYSLQYCVTGTTGNVTAGTHTATPGGITDP